MRELIIKNRRPLVVLIHLGLWSAALVFALLLRFDFRMPAAYWDKLPVWLGILLAIRSLTHVWSGMFHGMWRYTGVRDLITLVKATSAATLLFAAVTQLIGPVGFPRSIYVIEWLVSMALVGGLRFGIRALRELVLQDRPESGVQRRKILIVGAGDAGESLVREMRGKFAHKYEVVGFVDDHPAKQRERIHGVPVLGRIEEVPALVQSHGVHEIIVTIQRATAQQMRSIIEVCRTSGAVVRAVPAVEQLIDGRVTVNAVRPIAIEDLLGREPVQLETDRIFQVVRGRVVVVTGAGGSIGSELCRQLCTFHPARLILIEQAENSLFNVHRHLLAMHPEVEFVPCIADVCDATRIAAIFAKERPSLLFHAAAHKHVPMMEMNPGEAVKNNIFGTKTLADLADSHGIEKFVMISTDKAVNPTSVMGATKRAAELYLQSLSQRSATQFITVRFGNVLGSAGSVIPLFQEMIAKGGPVLVTHPEMRRYFMTIPEASQLVVQAATLGRGGEIFVLDMGEPVKIVDLARDLIKVSGLREEDIEIKFCGLRPGEKLFEEIALHEESVDKTRHPKIFVGRLGPVPLERVQRGFRLLHEIADHGSADQIKDALCTVVPEFASPERRSRPTPDPLPREALN